MWTGIARVFEGGEPSLAGLAARADRGQHLLRVDALDERVVDVQLDRQARELLQFLVGPEHQRIDAGDHARDRLVGDLGERLLAELEEDDIRTVAEHQELEVVVPHLREHLDRAMEVFAQIVVLPDAARLEHDLQVVELGQRRYAQLGDVADQRVHPRAPLGVQAIPVLVVVRGALLEDLEPTTDLAGVVDRIGGDVDAPVQHAELDAKRRGERKHARREGAERRVRNLGGEDVEGRHHLREMHRVVEPEALVVLRLELRVVRVHRFPVACARNALDLRGQREAAGLCLRVHGSPPADAVTIANRARQCSG